MNSVEISRTEPTTIHIILHRFKGAIVSAERKIFSSKTEAEAWIEWLFENDPALDHKDSFYTKEVVVDES